VKICTPLIIPKPLAINCPAAYYNDCIITDLHMYVADYIYARCDPIKYIVVFRAVIGLGLFRGGEVKSMYRS